MKRLAAATLFSLLATIPACESQVDLGPTKRGAADEAPLTHAVDVEKLDLLFVVDNSSSMADKQVALSKRVPELVRRVTQIGASNDAASPPKIVDLHVAVITTSLGSQGTSACDPALYGPHVDDRAHLLPRGGEALPAEGWRYDPASGSSEPTPAACPTVAPGAPIRWVLDPARDPSAQFQGEGALPSLEAAVSCTVLSAKDDGCGYEMPLEAMYRFLIDPAPPASVAATCTKSPAGDSCSGSMAASGIDQDVLSQRAAFLRPDSLLAVVFVSDENDASLRPEGVDWLPWAYAKGTMPKGTSGCAGVPDDVEPTTEAEYAALHEKYGCWSCYQEGRPDDPACSAPWSTTPTNADVDGRNLRGLRQVQRFGYEFLHPISRYVDGLTRKHLVGADGAQVLNPIFAGGRSRDLVVVAGILGAPTTLVNDAQGAPKRLDAAGWAALTSGDPAVRDPHMIESIAPRPGLPRFAGDPSVDPTNGGERDVPDGDDLQYACLGAPTDNGLERNRNCEAPGSAALDPACTGGAQVRARAYPSLRPLRVIRDVGSYGYVASICDASYRGAVAGIAAKIGEGCAGK